MACWTLVAPAVLAVLPLWVVLPILATWVVLEFLALLVALVDWTDFPNFRVFATLAAVYERPSSTLPNPTPNTPAPIRRELPQAV